jgi:nicotinamide phosphoribosyltransferase
MNTKSMLLNSLMSSDSYKYSHWVQYPDNTTGLFSYIESRGTTTRCRGTLFFGLQDFIKNALSIRLTHDDVDATAKFMETHGEPFNAEGWHYIVDKHEGYLPIRIRAVKEGTFVPLSNALVTCESTDPNCAWVESFIETALLRAVWYPTTVATNSYYCKQIIRDALKETSDDPEGELLFKLRDFGARGVSSLESAAIGGMAHLVNFMGTDTVSGIIRAMESYDSGVCGYSIPAAEHSTMTSWGKDNEYDAYNNMVEQYAHPGKIFAVVSDSYDIFNAVENIWIGSGLLAKVKERGATVVIRPDSGDPTRVPIQLIDLLCSKYGFTMNSKGYKVLPPEVRIIQGDGITPSTLKTILENLKLNGFSASNIAFGMGGGLLQMVDRDTFKFAMKCSAAEIDGKWQDVYKEPVGDSSKVSKKGRITLARFKDTGEVATVLVEALQGMPADALCMEDLMQTVYDNGPVESAYENFDTIRARSNTQT